MAVIRAVTVDVSFNGELDDICLLRYYKHALPCQVEDSKLAGSTLMSGTLDIILKKYYHNPLSV